MKNFLIFILSVAIFIICVTFFIFNNVENEIKTKIESTGYAKVIDNHFSKGFLKSSGYVVVNIDKEHLKNIIIQNTHPLLKDILANDFKELEVIDLKFKYEYVMQHSFLGLITGFETDGDVEILDSVLAEYSKFLFGTTKPLKLKITKKLNDFELNFAFKDVKLPEFNIKLPYIKAFLNSKNEFKNCIFGFSELSGDGIFINKFKLDWEKQSTFSKHTSFFCNGTTKYNIEQFIFDKFQLDDINYTETRTLKDKNCNMSANVGVKNAEIYNFNMKNFLSTYNIALSNDLLEYFIKQDKGQNLDDLNQTFEINVDNLTFLNSENKQLKLNFFLKNNLKESNIDFKTSVSIEEDGFDKFFNTSTGIDSQIPWEIEDNKHKININYDNKTKTMMINNEILQLEKYLDIILPIL